MLLPRLPLKTWLVHLTCIYVVSMSIMLLLATFKWVWGWIVSFYIDFFFLPEIRFNEIIWILTNWPKISIWIKIFNPIRQYVLTSGTGQLPLTQNFWTLYDALFLCTLRISNVILWIWNMGKFSNYKTQSPCVFGDLYDFHLRVLDCSWTTISPLVWLVVS